MTRWENLYFTSYLLALAVPAIKVLRHEASSPHNFFIQFPILAKSLMIVEGVALNLCVHQYCVISVAPPLATGSKFYISQFRLPTCTYMNEIWHYCVL